MTFPAQIQRCEDIIAASTPSSLSHSEMFGSPATVRGGTGRRRGGDGASVVRGTPSLLPEPQGHVGLGRPAGSVRSSRLGQLRRAGSPVSSAGDTFRTGRTEVGTSEKTVWARNERYSVVDAGHLPEDVQDLIGQASGSPRDIV